jgi:hypothetical protein
MLLLASSSGTTLIFNQKQPSSAILYLGILRRKMIFKIVIFIVVATIVNVFFCCCWCRLLVVSLLLTTTAKQDSDKNKDNVSTKTSTSNGTTTKLKKYPLDNNMDLHKHVDTTKDNKQDKPKFLKFNSSDGYCCCYWLGKLNPFAFSLAHSMSTYFSVNDRPKEQIRIAGQRDSSPNRTVHSTCLIVMLPSLVGYRHTENIWLQCCTCPFRCRCCAIINIRNFQQIR